MDREEKKIMQELMELYDENTVRVYYENIGDLDDFEDNFLGCFYGSSEEQCVAEMLYEMYSDEVPSTFFENYIDWESMARDALLGGDVWAERVEINQFAVFSNR